MVKCIRCSTEFDNEVANRCPFCDTPLKVSPPTSLAAPPLIPGINGAPATPFIPPVPQAPPPYSPTTLGVTPAAFGQQSPTVPPLYIAQANQHSPGLNQTQTPQPGGWPGQHESTGPAFGNPNRPGGLPPPTTYTPSSISKTKSGGSNFGMVMGGVGGGFLVLLVIGLRIWRIVHLYNIATNGSGSSSDYSNGNYSGGNSFSTASGSNPHDGEMSDPLSTTRNVMNCLHSQDWRTFYFLSVFHQNESKSDGAASAFASELNMLMSTRKNGQDFQQVMRSLDAGGIKYGSPNTSGDTCDITTEAKTSYMGRQLILNGIAHLTKLNGHWYLNLMASGGRSTATAFGDLAGLDKLRTADGQPLFAGGMGFFTPPQMQYPAMPGQSPTSGNLPGNSNPTFGGSTQPDDGQSHIYLPPRAPAPPNYPTNGGGNFPTGPRFGPGFGRQPGMSQGGGSYNPGNNPGAGGAPQSGGFGQSGGNGADQNGGNPPGPPSAPPDSRGGF